MMYSPPNDPKVIPFSHLHCTTEKMPPATICFNECKQEWYVPYNKATIDKLEYKELAKFLNET